MSRSSRRAVTSTREATPTILLYDADPYMGFLIRLDLPNARIVEADEADALEGLLSDRRPDLVIVNLASDSADEAVGRLRGVAMIGVASGARPQPGMFQEIDARLEVPFLPVELHAAVRKALNLSPPGQPSPTPAVKKVEAWLGPGRVVAVGLAGLLEVTTNADSGGAWILAGTLVYSLVRLIYRRTSQISAAADLAVATLLLALTGGLSSGYGLFGLVASVEAGMVFGVRTGVMGGALVATGSFVEVLNAVEKGSAAVRELVAWVLLFPLAALAASLWARISRGGGAGERQLSEANRVLSALHRIARAMPGHLEVGGAAARALSNVRETLGSPYGLLLLGEAGIYAPSASYGLAVQDLLIDQDDELIVHLLEGGVRVVKSHDLPPKLQGPLGEHDCWLVAPLGYGGIAMGLLIVACPSESTHDDNSLILQQLATEAGIAIENARLFRQVQELSIDEERRRLARELHDAVAQALTHIRLELEFLARHGVPSIEAAGEEAARLARVVDRAASEVRVMINGLSSMVSREGLAASLSAYLRDLRGLVTREITFESNGVVRLPTDVEGEVFRIAQEAVSNALRHSKAQRIHVSLGSAPSGLTLVVEDDGVGPVTAKNGKGKGLGLKSMMERTESLGAQLDIEARPSGGTRVILSLMSPTLAGEHNIQESS